MRAFLLVVPTLLFLGVLAFTTPRTARADEEPKDESAASKAYRDAWWAETGGGNLNQALDLYAKAIDAEGPASVKARALYRRAVVLQRIGKTEEALRALERLSKDFPGETQANSDARARLAEWTAVDLRSSFADWFKRYQYSPEFQAKVVDLVLKLGGDDPTRQTETALLTIGEAAIPALKEHVASKNQSLALRAIKVLLLLGHVPDEVVEPHGWWTSEADAWVAILKLSEPRRIAMRAQVVGQSPTHDALRAALDGTEAVMAWLATPGSDAESRERSALLAGLIDTLPKDSRLHERIADLALAEGQGEQMRNAFVYWASEHGRVTSERVKAWALHPSVALRRTAWSYIEGKAPLAPADAWPIVLRAVEGHGGKKWTDEQVLGGAFHRALEGAPWPQDLDRAADALIKNGGGLGRGGGSARLAEVLARAFERAANEAVASQALSEWSQVMGAKPEVLSQLAHWARTAPTLDRRRLAASHLGSRALPDRREAMLELLVDPEVPEGEALAFWSAFFGNDIGPMSQGTALLSDPAALRRLLDRILAAKGQPSPARNRFISAMVGHLDHHAPLVETLLAVMFEAPDRVPWELLNWGNFRTALDRSGSKDRQRKALRDGWAGWTPVQRTSILQLANSLLDLDQDPESAAFFRARLRARPLEIEPDVRYLVLSSLGDLTLDDLRATYDLSKAEDADDAAQFLAQRNPGKPRRLKGTPDVFQALRLAIRPDANPWYAEIFTGAFNGVPEVQPELMSALLAHATDHVRTLGADLLVARSSPSDEALWLKALKDESAVVRTGVAKGMERVPTDGIKRALVGALDDPHPDVRAAALASLDNLQKMEDLKARWREKVK